MAIEYYIKNRDTGYIVATCENSVNALKVYATLVYPSGTSPEDYGIFLSPDALEAHKEKHS